MIVYVVARSTPYEGDEVDSVWLNESDADARMVELDDGYSFGVVHIKEVK